MRLALPFDRKTCMSQDQYLSMGENVLGTLMCKYLALMGSWKVNDIGSHGMSYAMQVVPADPRRNVRCSIPVLRYPLAPSFTFLIFCRLPFIMNGILQCCVNVVASTIRQTAHIYFSCVRNCSIYTSRPQFINFFFCQF